jgi:hypothetical protein
LMRISLIWTDAFIVSMISVKTHNTVTLELAVAVF